jgi:hypothetical protein
MGDSRICRCCRCCSRHSSSSVTLISLLSMPPQHPFHPALQQVSLPLLRLSAGHHVSLFLLPPLPAWKGCQGHDAPLPLTAARAQ